MARSLFVALCLALSACNTAPGKGAAMTSTYDPALAAKLGADERGMRQYVLVILKTGPGDKIQGPERDKIFEGHFGNIARLTKEGKLLLAGPFSPNDKQYRGLFLFNTADKDEAARLVATDPAVVAGVFQFEIYPWYGSAALMEAPVIHRRLEKPAP